MKTTICTSLDIADYEAIKAGGWKWSQIMALGLKAKLRNWEGLEMDNAKLQLKLTQMALEKK